MGTFGGYIGSMRIAEEKKELFVKQMSRLLNLGGMMQFEEISMYGHDMGLLKPIEIFPGGKVYFHYNYFEDDSWETACFESDSCILWSEKIGWAEFGDVIIAGYTLYEAYDEEGGMAEVNGDIVESSSYMGWINNILGTSFSMKNRFKLWEKAEECAFCRIESGYNEAFTESVLETFIPDDLKYAAGGIELADLLYIIKGTSSLCNKDVIDGSYPADILNCKRVLKNYFQSSIENSVENLWDFLKKTYDLREKESDKQLKDIAEMSLFIPARVFIYLTAEIKDLEFWKIWRELKDFVYNDEHMKKYVSDELLQWRRAEQEKPIKPVATSSFLGQNEAFTFFKTPEEVEGISDYFISDDDRLYWWDGTDEVKISEETDKWLKELGQQHRDLIEKGNYEEVKSDFLNFFLLTISEIDDYYKRIYPFQSMFYEFVQNGNQKEYVVAIVLLKKLADSEKYRKTGEVIKYLRKSGWSMTSKKIKCNYARIHLKRYLSVMANKRLRERYFGF